MPLSRKAFSTGLTSFAVSTKSPVIAALPDPVGWKLMTIPDPAAIGTSMPPSVILSARGILNPYTPAFAVHFARSVPSIAAVSRSIGGRESLPAERLGSWVLGTSRRAIGSPQTQEKAKGDSRHD